MLESGLLDGRGRPLRAGRPAAAARDPGDAAGLADGAARPPRAGQGGGADRRGDRPRVLLRAARRGRRLGRRPSCRPRSTSWSPPSWCSAAARRPRRPTASSTRWCRTPPTQPAQEQAPAAARPDRRRCSRSASRSTIESQPELLAHHCTEAGLVEQAVDYWHEAGELALARSADAEAVGQLQPRPGTAATRCPRAAERDERELELQIALGRALIAAKGWAAPEIGDAYARARELCEKSAMTPAAFPALYGLCASTISIAASSPRRRRSAEELLRLARRRRMIAAKTPGSPAVGNAGCFLGSFDAARAHLEQALALYDPRSTLSRLRYAADPRVAVSTCCRLDMWLSRLPGPSARAQRTKRALAEASERHAISLAFALQLPAFFQLRGEIRARRGAAAALSRSPRSRACPFWSATGDVFHGWALAEQGQRGRHCGLMAWQRSRPAPERDAQDRTLGMLAGRYRAPGKSGEALAAARRGLGARRETGERWFEAELHRLQGRAAAGRAARNRPRPKPASASAIAVARAARRQVSGSCAPRPASPGCGRDQGRARRGPRPARAGLRLVHRGLRYRRSEGRQGAARRAGVALRESGSPKEAGSRETSTPKEAAR